MTMETKAKPLITAVIPTFRRPRLLRRAIQSVLDQEDVELQVCVFDNASGDETADVVAEVAARDRRIVYHAHATNIGAAENFEFGISAVSTPFFSILSDDDYLLPGFYQLATQGLSNHPEAMCWAGMTLNVDDAGVIVDARVKAWPREGVFHPPEGFMRMTGGKAPVWTGVLFRREVLSKVGLPDRAVLGPSDFEFLLRLAARHPFVLSKHASAVFTLNATSFSATQPLSSFWPGWKKMMKKLTDDEGLDPVFRQDAIEALRKDACKMLFRRGAYALVGKRTDFALDAAEALQKEFGMTIRAELLRLSAACCERSPLLHRAYSSAYRMAEQRIVDSRSALQREYGALLRSA
jgi:glycosyltransferase involved in cell wall biosynthesis